MVKFSGIFAFIPATIILTISFFVLALSRRIDSQALKSFGRVLAACLWIAAAIVFSTGIYISSIGKHMPYGKKCAKTKTGMYKQMMHKKMPHHMAGQKIDSQTGTTEHALPDKMLESPEEK